LKGKKEGENNKAMKIATEMLKDGIEIKTISKYTKLSMSEIEALKVNNNE